MTLKENPIVLRLIETELRNIRQLIDDEKNPSRKAKMINVYGKMSSVTAVMNSSRNAC